MALQKKRKRPETPEDDFVLLSKSLSAAKRKRLLATDCLQPGQEDVFHWRYFDFGEAGAGDLVGKFLKVYWDGDDKWFAARVLNFHPQTRRHFVHYPSDGTTEWISLDEQPCLIGVSPGWARVQGHGWWPARIVCASRGLENFMSKLTGRAPKNFGLPTNFAQRVKKSGFVVFFGTDDFAWLPKAKGNNLLAGLDPPPAAKKAMAARSAKAQKLREARDLMLEEAAQVDRVIQDVRELFVEEAKLRCASCQECGREAKVYKKSIIVAGNKPETVIVCGKCKRRFDRKEYCCVCVRLWKTDLEYRKEIVVPRPGGTLPASATVTKSEDTAGGVCFKCEGAPAQEEKAEVTKKEEGKESKEGTLPGGSIKTEPNPVDERKDAPATPSKPNGQELVQHAKLGESPQLSSIIKDLQDNQDEDTKMFGCDACGRWVHSSCDGIDDLEYAKACALESRHYSSDYFCPICRHIYMLQAIEEFSSLDMDELFQEPVTEEIAPGYFQVVSHPMDLRTMKEKAKRGVYRSSRMLKTDLELMIYNAVRYNPIRGVISKAVIAYFHRVNDHIMQGPRSNPILSGLREVGPTEHAANITTLIEQDKKQLSLSKKLRHMAKDTIQVRPPPLVPDPSVKPILQPRMLIVPAVEANELAFLDLCSLCGCGFGSCSDLFPSEESSSSSSFSSALEPSICHLCGEAFHGFCLEEAGFRKPSDGSVFACPSCLGPRRVWPSQRRASIVVVPEPESEDEEEEEDQMRMEEEVCTVCYRRWDPADPWMVQCEECNAWVHAGCDPNALKIAMIGVNSEHVKYQCLECRYQHVPETHVGVTISSHRLLDKVVKLQRRRERMLYRVPKRRPCLTLPAKDVDRCDAIIKMAMDVIHLNRDRALSYEDISQLRSRVSKNYPLFPNWISTRAARHYRKQCIRRQRDGVVEGYEFLEGPALIREAMGAAAFLTVLMFENVDKLPLGTFGGQDRLVLPGGFSQQLLTPPVSHSTPAWKQPATSTDELGLGFEHVRHEKFLNVRDCALRGWNASHGKQDGALDTLSTLFGPWKDPRYCYFCGGADGADPHTCLRGAIEALPVEAEGKQAMLEDLRTPNSLGRLLPAGDGTYAHAFCAVWSSEAFEEAIPTQKIGWGTIAVWAGLSYPQPVPMVESSSKNNDQSKAAVHEVIPVSGVSRGDGGIIKATINARRRCKGLRCTFCFCPGATLGCCAPGCSSNFHFSCAIAAQAVLTTHKEVYCRSHANRNGALTRALPVRVFREPLRSLVLSGDVNQSTTSPLHHVKPTDIPLRIGTLTVMSLGSLPDYPLFHDQSTLFPIGFRSLRIHWSSQHHRRRCVYASEIRCHDDKAATSFSEADQITRFKPLFRVTAFELDERGANEDDRGALKTWEGFDMNYVFKQVMLEIQTIQCGETTWNPQSCFLNSGAVWFGMGLSPVKAAIELTGGHGVLAAAYPNPRFVRGGETAKNGKRRRHNLPQVLPYGCSFRKLKVDEVQELHREYQSQADSHENPYGCARADPNPNLRLTVQQSTQARNASSSSRLRKDTSSDATAATEVVSERTSHSSSSHAYRILKSRPFQAHLEAKRSAIHGWGLFTKEAINQDGMIVEYIGQLIGNAVGDNYESFYETVGIGSCYMFRLNSTHIVDATRNGNLARFMNHSCQPNAYAKVIQVHGDDQERQGERIVICAKRKIAAGEEITYDYKFATEEGKLTCKCGAPNCRGAMN